MNNITENRKRCGSDYTHEETVKPAKNFQAIRAGHTT